MRTIQESPTEGLLTTQQTMERLGISAHQLVRMRVSRRISYFKRGGTVLFAPAEVERVRKAFEVPALRPVVKVKELGAGEVAR